MVYETGLPEAEPSASKPVMLEAVTRRTLASANTPLRGMSVKPGLLQVNSYCEQFMSSLISERERRCGSVKSLLVVAAVLALYACKDSPVAGPSDRTFSLSAVTPVDLSSTVGAQVVPSPTVRVTDSNGAPLAGTPISFEVTSGNGSLTSTLVQTDAAGFATVGWTLDTIAGANRMIVVRSICLPFCSRLTGQRGR